MYYVYILLLNDGTIYKGFSDDLKRRYKEHENGKVKSTRNKRPIRLIYYESYFVKKDARLRESYLKTGDGRREIKIQLKNTLK